MDPPPNRYYTPLYRKGSSAPRESPSETPFVDRTPHRAPALGSRRLSKGERKSRYDRMETLTKELGLALKDEIGRRKDSWDGDGDREEEAQWETRKKEIYAGLEELAGEIKRALRDRSKEAVLDLWEQEMEDRRVQRIGNLRHGTQGYEIE